ncbi:hypothetical protein GOP47_0023323 [Adiantum capillus-veneris]|uniref:Secreted protein n=1 Tax=Adiantum capillus-veneris TaxID=13818 RepID=A0A9D4Z659_ADICA|nr:hypothetical protein GOP47_0023323 [Adiantum capillus-veneris]
MRITQVVTLPCLVCWPLTSQHTPPETPWRPCCSTLSSTHNPSNPVPLRLAKASPSQLAPLPSSMPLTATPQLVPLLHATRSGIPFLQISKGWHSLHAAPRWRPPPACVARRLQPDISFFFCLLIA